MTPVIIEKQGEWLVPCRDSYQRRYFLTLLKQELAAHEGDSPPPPPAPPRRLQPCVVCGRMSERRWCCNAHYVMDEGPIEDYPDEEDYE